MNEFDFRSDAERITFPRLIKYLDPKTSRVWGVNDAEITAVRRGNRTGVPRDAETYRYTIHYPAGGWAVTVRAVWHDEDLFRPATLCCVEDYVDLEGVHGDKWVVQGYLLDWLRGVPGL